MSKVFGGSKQSSVNTNNPALTTALTPATGLVGQSGDMMSKLLGGGFQGYKDQSGMNWSTGQGVEGITSNAAAKGLLNSGATGKAIANYGNNQANSYFNNYLQNVQGMGQLGLGASGVLAQSGQSSSGSSKPGLTGLIGALNGRAASGF